MDNPKFPYRSEKIGVYALGTGIAKGPYERSARYLKNYYERYDIPLYVAKEDDERVWGTFHKLRDAGIAQWHAAVTCRFQLLHTFLETDQQYFILQDLDYVVSNPEVNIRDYLPDFVCPNWTYQPEFWNSHLSHKRKYKIQTEILRDYDPNIKMPTLRHICADFIGMTRAEVLALVNFYKECGVDTSNTDEFAAWCGDKANTVEDINSAGWEKHMQEEELFATYLAGKNITPTNIEETNIRMDCWHMRGSAENWLNEVIKLIRTLKDPRHAFIHFGACDKIAFFDNILDLFPC